MACLAVIRRYIGVAMVDREATFDRCAIESSSGPLVLCAESTVAMPTTAVR